MKSRFQDDTKKGQFNTRFLATEKDLEQAYKLRYSIFVEKLKWVTGVDGMDKDQFDTYAKQIGVFNGTNLLGVLRVINSENDFMIDRDFSYLLDNHQFHKISDSVEVSRLAVDSRLTKKEKTKVVFLLYYYLYKWLKSNSIRYVYFVTTHKLIGSLKQSRKLQIQVLGNEGVTHDGVTFQVALIDLRELSLGNKILYLIQYFLI